MSRFLEIIHKISREKINRKKIRSILTSTKEILGAKSAQMEVYFPYFIKKEAPVSKAQALMEYECALFGTHDEKDEFQLILEVNALVLNLCPCSRELSPEASAHNQRSRVTVRMQSGPLIWIEDIIDLIESCASSPIFTVLKRVDEKYVMEKAHNNPRFVEDIVRQIASKLENLEGVCWFSVESENFESIHTHNVYACIERGEKKGCSQ